MALAITHPTPPDGTFSAAGASAWTAQHSVSGSVDESMLSISDTVTGDVSAAAHGFAPKTPNDSTKFLNGVGQWAVPPNTSIVAETQVTFSDTTYGNVSAAAHGLVPKAPNNANLFLNGQGNWTAVSATVTSIADTQVVFSDTAYGNVSSTAHGYAPKTPNDATKFLNGQGNWTAVSATVSSVADTQVTFADTVYGNVSTSAHGFAPKVTNTANFLKGDGTWASPGTPTFPGGIPMTGVSYPSAAAYKTNCATGNNDIYTVPTGKRAMVSFVGLFNNSGVGNIVWYPQVKISGTYYRLGATNTASNNSTSTTVVRYVAEANEIISVNTATNNGANIGVLIIEFDDSCSIFSPKLTSLSAGDNTVYTVTTGKTAVVLQNLSGFNSGSGTVNNWNSSGGSRTYIWKLTPNGGSATQFIPSTSLADAGFVALGWVAQCLQSGDAVICNSDAATATQFAWLTVVEY